MLRPDLNTGATVTATATGQLTLHGVTRPVTFTISGRRNGPALQPGGAEDTVLLGLVSSRHQVTSARMPPAGRGAGTAVRTR